MASQAALSRESRVLKSRTKLGAVRAPNFVCFAVEPVWWARPGVEAQTRHRRAADPPRKLSSQMSYRLVTAWFAFWKTLRAATMSGFRRSSAP